MHADARQCMLMHADVHANENQCTLIEISALVSMLLAEIT